MLSGKSGKMWHLNRGSTRGSETICDPHSFSIVLYPHALIISDHALALPN